MVRRVQTLVLLACLAAASPGFAADDRVHAPSPVPEVGADTCLACHPNAAAVLGTRHGATADAGAPFGSAQCEACHGPGLKHVQGDPATGQRLPLLRFGTGSPDPAADQNAACGACHAGSLASHWTGSAHEREDLGCADCHRIHIRRDPVLGESTQPAVCYQCHPRQRTAFEKPYTHPVRYGQMTCTACHAPHGSPADFALKQSTINNTCYDCHAEKRGPFLWEHPAATDDCSNCHLAHGSVQPALLVKRPPLLCQECHAPAGHPQVAYGPGGLPAGTPQPYLLVGGCVNCHSAVHGSNHPSGSKLMR